MDRVPIELASESDLATLAELEIEAYHPRLVTSLRGFRRIFAGAQEEGESLWVERQEGVLRGFCHLALNAPDAGWTTVCDLAVFKRHQGQGVGRVLLAHVRDYAREEGQSVLLLHVPEDHAVARRIYESFGFAVVDRIPNYYPPQGAREGEFFVTALVMTLAL